MSPERWAQIKNTVQKQFGIQEQGTEDLMVQTGEGPKKQGEAEFVIFSGPMGQMKLQFQKKPKLEEKKFHFSHRQGDSARVEYRFSDSEMVYALKVYKWNEAEDEWKEIDAGAFGNQI